MGTVSRLQLFTDIIDEIGDGAILTASEDGAVDTFISTDEMLYADGSFDGREVWYATSADPISADNAGGAYALLADQMIEALTTRVAKEMARAHGAVPGGGPAPGAGLAVASAFTPRWMVTTSAASVRSAPAAS